MFIPRPFKLLHPCCYVLYVCVYSIRIILSGILREKIVSSFHAKSKYNFMFLIISILWYDF